MCGGILLETQANKNGVGPTVVISTSGTTVEATTTSTSRLQRRLREAELVVLLVVLKERVEEEEMWSAVVFWSIFWRFSLWCSLFRRYASCRRATDLRHSVF
jgi:hypothetical protein